jgi:hypothetical protein
LLSSYLFDLDFLRLRALFTDHRIHEMRQQASPFIMATLDEVLLAQHAIGRGRPCISKSDLLSTQMIIGRNRAGMWVVRDPLGMHGGLFISRAEAFRFATSDPCRPQMALTVPYVIEFDEGRSPEAAKDHTRAGRAKGKTSAVKLAAGNLAPTSAPLRLSA